MSEDVILWKKVEYSHGIKAEGIETPLGGVVRGPLVLDVTAGVG
jgi:hypothetical protein